MTTLDDRVTVWRLATLTEDLDLTERRALRDEGQRLEREWNKLTTRSLERLDKVGMLDLLGPAGVKPTKSHAEWWSRFRSSWDAYQRQGRSALEPTP